jgi:hypothetical protein
VNAEQALDALERQVEAGTIGLRAALAYAWQHGCKSGGAQPWPDFDVRRVGLRWAVVRVRDGRVMSDWADEREARDAMVRQVCTPSVHPSEPPPPSGRK